MTHRSPLLALALLAALPACATIDADPAVDSETHAIDCPPWQCGVNAATINELPLGELHLVPGQNTGELSAWSARIVDFVAPPDAPEGPRGYTLRVIDGRFSAHKDDLVLRGPELIGSRITIDDEANDTTVEMIIHDYSEMPSWTTPVYNIPRYVLVSYEEELDRYHPVCQDAEDPADGTAWSVLVSGERYSWEEKTITQPAGEARGWFNVACKDNALYKMKFMGYEPEPQGQARYITSPAQRQAALKMLTADYCGTGTSFTETGTPLHWVNDRGWSDNGNPPTSTVEALWSKDGALCLDTPRLGAEQLAEIEAECASVGRVLRSCAGFTDYYDWMSETPLCPSLP
ncbi:ADYC domain-containing protein [Haliangium ochraceum]|uniref:ADYC domain-containing protein n=1 Tax=Haliangium ochraceum (strain DSM 14365 / JCM 11303 / SMP-2) TaxID=502025 RepID=D0LJQ3_HALO1|nr:ADYC domain-containing protein [Haliangium ochraceum]ACY16627.1 hypothetical protein Hoch_4129 [Haliangium ochraceum DSM 14365]